MILEVTVNFIFFLPGKSIILQILLELRVIHPPASVASEIVALIADIGRHGFDSSGNVRKTYISEILPQVVAHLRSEAQMPLARIANAVRLLLQLSAEQPGRIRQFLNHASH